ncbi:hypothetical protein [Pseudomarimonas salicorniae]|uniref:Sensor domain CHASE2-containing protein n=1 Tax=Pseudomarimonas salicorniae TaxID=2933270 RepID=A0ABT0GH10_9GAMM|nr:hypothetical protein [Lysobacter sp. CAU 1642]MCK7593831.1 hypothetical protein [Lysobacter sp. CAU 1642]
MALCALGLPLVWLAMAAFLGGARWQPEQVREIPLASAQSRTSALEATDAGLLVRGMDAEGRALVLFPTATFSLDELPMLRVRLSGTTPLHAARLVAGRGEALAVAPYPGHPEGEVVRNLRRAGFKAEVQDHVGLLISPPDTLPAAAADAVDIRIHSVRLESPSLPAQAEALLRAWFGYRPWIGRSNHTAGFEHGGQPLPGLAVGLSLWLLWSAAIIWLTRARQPMRRFGALVLFAALLLGVVQLQGQLLRAEVAQLSASAARHAGGLPQSALPALEREVAEASAGWDASDRRKVVVWGGNGFLREYPVWLLRAHNVGGLQRPEQLDRLPADEPAILLLAGQAGWRFDPLSGRLHLGKISRPARPEFRGSWVHTFVLGGSATP